MKKILFVGLCLSGMLVSNAQNFGTYANAVFLKVDNTSSFYNTNPTSASDPNSINTSGQVFQNANLGSFTQNSGSLSLMGAELKTFKTAAANVCQPILYYRVYTTGSPSGTFSPVSINFFESCSGGAFSNSGGPCGGNDQKYQTNNANIDLTTMLPGNYTLEVYYQVPGSNSNTTDCTDNVYESNNNNPTNYTANFTVTSILPLHLLSFGGRLTGTTVQFNWSTANEVNVNNFEIESSTNGSTWQSVATTIAKNVASAQYVQVVPAMGNVTFYRLKTVNKDGKISYSGAINIKNSSNGISLIGNPAKDLVRIAISGGAAKYTAALYSLAGSRIAVANYAHTGGSATIQLPVSTVAPGTYVLKVSNGIEEKSLKVIIQ